MTAGMGRGNGTPISRTPAATAHIPSSPDPASATTANPGARSASDDAIIRQLFDISMTLASCAKTTDKHAASRVMEAIDGLDHVMSDLRTAIFEAGTPEPTPLPARSELNGGPW